MHGCWFNSVATKCAEFRAWSVQFARSKGRGFSHCWFLASFIQHHAALQKKKACGGMRESETVIFSPTSFSSVQPHISSMIMFTVQPHFVQFSSVQFSSDAHAHRSFSFSSVQFSSIPATATHDARGAFGLDFVGHHFLSSNHYVQSSVQPLVEFFLRSIITFKVQLEHGRRFNLAATECAEPFRTWLVRLACSKGRSFSHVAWHGAVMAW